MSGVQLILRNVWQSIPWYRNTWWMTFSRKQRAFFDQSDRMECTCNQNKIEVGQDTHVVYFPQILGGPRWKCLWIKLLQSLTSQGILPQKTLKTLIFCFFLSGEKEFHFFYFLKRYFKCWKIHAANWKHVSPIAFSKQWLFEFCRLCVSLCRPITVDYAVILHPASTSLTHCRQFCVSAQVPPKAPGPNNDSRKGIIIVCMWQSPLLFIELTGTLDLKRWWWSTAFQSLQATRLPACFPTRR